MYPEDVLQRNYLFDVWKRVAKSFGYEEYDTPILEEADLYRVKSGDELANNQLFNFVDKGGREVSLRPEMTPSLARIVAAKKYSLTLPIRWFNIGRFYRYEKPQKGRTREFVQLNIDILGVSSIEAEVEIIQFVMKVMQELKAKEGTYELKINNRYLFDYLVQDLLKIDGELKEKLAKAIDNYLKMEKSTFNEYLEDIGLSDSQRDTVLEYLNWEIKDLVNIKDSSRGARELLDLFDRLEKLRIKNVKFCPYIMRGLAYYTGTVVEMYDIGSKENPRALFGGGRYDNLLEIFGQEKLPAFGLGWGDVTTLDYLRTYNLLPKLKTEIDVFITLMESSYSTEISDIATFLRENGLNVQVQLTPTKLSKQLQYADKKGIRWVVIVGEEERNEGIIQLKDMNTKQSYMIKKEELIDRIG